MKKVILTFASICLVASIYSCRETKEEKAELKKLNKSMQPK